ncbi:hypothetical protein SAMN05216374_5949 [Tardiphaga sp. OK246]|uniref:HNH endonuclease n=1 Tax=Tardiphaga sp. OK246 TaxID=1855307 RepID=UPI000B6B9F9C|nr:hypothetical protein [Tardiphaga sp. OK246]SNT61651.1 hypothetical protein SAMN05216374_5949 [Tardiphaga sp. OK246]
MRSLPPPLISTAQVLASCLTGTDDADLKRRIGSIAGELDIVGNDYDACGKQQMLHLIARVTSVGSVTKQELENLYSNHLSASGGAARYVYDAIRNAVPNKRCPLCGVGTVAVLDHHLPKSKYPNLSITPANLVPACHFCNNTKRARFPKGAGEQTLHPYYDGYLIDQWVWAKLDQLSPLVVLYFAQGPDHWSDVDRSRVLRHFKICGLATTFMSNGNDELSVLKGYLEELYLKGGFIEVAAYLSEQAYIHAVRPNSWQFAMYQLLSTDNWFVNGGFRNIS